MKADMKAKNSEKMEYTKHKHDSLIKDNEEYQLRLHAESLKDIEHKLKNRELLLQQRHEELKRQEDMFDKKRKFIERQRLLQEQQQMKQVAASLKNIGDRISQGTQKHEHQLQRVASEARMRNTLQSEKVDRWREERAREEQEEMWLLYINEEKCRKKVVK